METYDIKNELKEKSRIKKWTMQIFKRVLLKYKMTTFKKTIMDIWLAFSFEKFAKSVAKLNKKKKKRSRSQLTANIYNGINLPSKCPIF